jgi:thiol-disulfide isomerase/thioredoxin
MVVVLAQLVQALALFLAAHSLIAICSADQSMPRSAPEPKAVQSPAESLEALWKQSKAIDDAYTAYVQSTDEDEKERLWKAYTLSNDALIPRIPAAVRRDPGSPLGGDLLAWTVANGRISVKRLRPYGSEAIELLRDHYTTHSNLAMVCRALGALGDPSHKPTIEFLQRTAAENPDRGTKDYATLALGLLTKSAADDFALFEIAPWMATNSSALNQKPAGQGPRWPDSKTAFHEAEVLFETVAKAFDDCPNFPAGPGLRNPKATLGEQARLELAECRNLVPGTRAPEISGKDLEGRALKLSDYHGKVIVLTFWASWCGPCMQMVPHERAMAERFQDKPFALIGVNGDGDISDAQSAASKEKMTWHSFWNGAGGPDESIAAALNVRAWPTIYIIDRKGVIRLRLSGYGKYTDALLDDVTDRLLKETRVD